MPICTYIEKDKALQIPENLDKELLELLNELRKRKIELGIQKREFVVKAYWFKPNTTKPYHQLLWPIDDMECQIVNFYSDYEVKELGSINTWVRADVAYAYMLGLLVALERKGDS